MSDSSWQANLAFLATAVPLAAYFLLKSAGWFTAGVVAALVLFLFFNGVLLRRFKWVDVTFILFFLAMLVGVSWLEIGWMKEYRNVFAPAMLAFLAYGSVLIGKPFTQQYARERMAPVWWDNPHFHRVNRILAWVWGTCFATGAVLAFLAVRMEAWPLWLSYAASAGLSIFALTFTARFPKWYRREVYLPQAGPNPLPD